MSLFRNPALLLVIGLPLAAVVGSFFTLGLAISRPDSELPEQYHWEGFQLDRDFSRGQRASELQVHARLGGFRMGGRCELEVSMKGSAPESLTLLVSHGTLPKYDQKVRFSRVAMTMPARYTGDCQAAPEGPWRLELEDDANGWAVRRSLRGSLEAATLDAARGEEAQLMDGAAPAAAASSSAH